MIKVKYHHLQPFLFWKAKERRFRWRWCLCLWARLIENNLIPLFGRIEIDSIEETTK